MLDVHGHPVRRVVGIARAVDELPALWVFSVMSHKQDGPAQLHHLASSNDEAVEPHTERIRSDTSVAWASVRECHPKAGACACAQVANLIADTRRVRGIALAFAAVFAVGSGGVALGLLIIAVIGSAELDFGIAGVPALVLAATICAGLALVCLAVDTGFSIAQARSHRARVTLGFHLGIAAVVLAGALASSSHADAKILTFGILLELCGLIAVTLGTRGSTSQLRDAGASES